MVESLASSVSDKLIDNLSFKIAPGASYVQSRASCQWYSNGANAYEPVKGNRVIRIPITSSDGWIDPSTIRLCFEVQNQAGVPLRLFSGGHSFISRARLMVGSVVCEDISSYARTAQMLQCLKSKHSRLNEQASGTGLEWSDHEFQTHSLKPIAFVAGAIEAPSVGNIVASRGLNTTNYTGIPANGTQVIIQKLIFGLFAQEKFLPLKYMQGGLVVEIELVQDPNDVALFDTLSATDALEITASTAAAGVPARLKSSFHQANCSNTYLIQNVFIAADVITLDNQLDNSYADHVLSGKSLSINYNTYVSQMQSILDQNKPSVNISRSLTRLKTVFMSLEKDDLQNAGYTPGARPWRTFWSPMAPENLYGSGQGYPDGGNFTHNQKGEFSYSIQLGGTQYPQIPMRSHAEAYMHLVKAVGIQSSDVHSFDVTPKQYRSNKFITAIDMEKILGASFTGANTRAGDILSVKFEWNNSGNLNNGTVAGNIAATSSNPLVVDANARLASRMHIVLHSDNIIEIGANGVSVFD